MDNLDFSEEEIQEQLALLGYRNIPRHRLREFKRDLDELIRHGDLTNLTSPAQINSTRSQPSPPAYTKEKVSQYELQDGSKGFFLHARQADPERQVLTACQNRDDGRQQERSDSYAQHSVALKHHLPPGAPTRLQVEPGPIDTLQQSLSDSYASSSDGQGRRFIRRKVLRKHKGKSLVCDESVYSEDSDHTARLNMYRMYGAQPDGDTDDEKSSLNSSFWSDGEREEEEEEVERVTGEGDFKPAEESHPKASGEEKAEGSKSSTSEQSSDGEDGEDDDGEDEDSCSSSCDSPAPSLMTSGYGTYRPEEQDGGDDRDDGSDAAFDQDSRGDLSELRDDEDDGRSLCSFMGSDVEPAGQDDGETRPLSVLADVEPAAQVAAGGDELCVAADITHMTTEEEAEEEALSQKEAANVTQCGAVSAVKLQMDGANLGGGRVDAEEEKQPEEGQERPEEAEESDESSSNRDIRFIDSKVDFSLMTWEWEGNLRRRKDAASCLEERLAELRLSTSAQRDSETENEDVTGRSDGGSSDAEEISMSAFESYIRGMTGAPSEADARPKPKSFIRPLMSQQTVKKTDPVAKYFQYKQLWDMFKLPGEKDHRALRLEIKERLAYQPPPPRPRRVYVPNTYMVPTEKKRSALRWEIRNDLANGLVPYKFSYRF